MGKNKRNLTSEELIKALFAAVRNNKTAEFKELLKEVQIQIIQLTELVDETKLSLMDWVCKRDNPAIFNLIISKYPHLLENNLIRKAIDYGAIGILKHLEQQKKLKLASIIEQAVYNHTVTETKNNMGIPLDSETMDSHHSAFKLAINLNNPQIIKLFTSWLLVLNELEQIASNQRYNELFKDLIVHCCVPLNPIAAELLIDAYLLKENKELHLKKLANLLVYLRLRDKEYIDNLSSLKFFAPYKKTIKLHSPIAYSKYWPEPAIELEAANYAALETTLSKAVIPILATHGQEPTLEMHAINTIKNSSAKDLQTIDCAGCSLVHYFAYYNLVLPMQALLDKKINIQTKNKNNVTAFDIAMVKGNYNLIMQLIDYSPSIIVLRDSTKLTNIFKLIVVQNDPSLTNQAIQLFKKHNFLVTVLQNLGCDPTRNAILKFIANLLLDSLLPQQWLELFAPEKYEEWKKYNLDDILIYCLIITQKSYESIWQKFIDLLNKDTKEEFIKSYSALMQEINPELFNLFTAKIIDTDTKPRKKFASKKQSSNLVITSTQKESEQEVVSKNITMHTNTSLTTITLAEEKGFISVGKKGKPVKLPLNQRSTLFRNSNQIPKSKEPTINTIVHQVNSAKVIPASALPATVNIKTNLSNLLGENHTTLSPSQNNSVSSTQLSSKNSQVIIASDDFRIQTLIQLVQLQIYHSDNFNPAALRLYFGSIIPKLNAVFSGINNLNTALTSAVHHYANIISYISLEEILSINTDPIIVQQGYHPISFIEKFDDNASYITKALTSIALYQNENNYLAAYASYHIIYILALKTNDLAAAANYLKNAGEMLVAVAEHFINANLSLKNEINKVVALFLIEANNLFSNATVLVPKFS